jgi:hypothetical protein
MFYKIKNNILLEQGLTILSSLFDCVSRYILNVLRKDSVLE